MITIGIASRDRPEVLDRTLRKIHGFGLSECPVIIFDDGSRPRLDPAAMGLFKRGRVIRVGEAMGQANGRNRVCEEATTPFVLQLDDDSYPVEGDMQALLKVAAEASNWLAIAIPFEEPGRGRWPAGVPGDRLIPVRSFVGCSALLHVENFRRLGGYAPWIRRTCEEEELAMRGWKAGFGIFSIDLLKNRHDVTEVGRSRSGIAYRSFQNWFLVWSLHAPGAVLPMRVFRLVAAAVLHAVRNRDLAALKGIRDGLRILPSVAQCRQALTLSEYGRWRRMPHALDFYAQARDQVIMRSAVELK